MVRCLKEVKLKPSEAIKILEEIKEDNNGMYKYHQLYCTAINMGILAIETLEKQKGTFEWCSDCAEYDKERHCCHRFTKVIRQTVEECKKEYANEGWIPVTKALPKEDCTCRVTVKTGYYNCCYNYVKNCYWNEQDKCFEEWSDYQDCYVPVSEVIAWKPCEDPYIEEKEE